MTNQTSVDSDGKAMTDASNLAGSTAQGTVYAMVGPWAPQYRKIVKIEMTENGPQSTVIQDYKLDGPANAVMEDALAALDQADSDDTPEQQQLLMAAWQALAMYLSSCDDEDKQGAAMALKQVSDLMSDADSGDGPFPTGTFGRTTQTAAAPSGAGGQQTGNSQNQTVYECAIDKRKFSSQAGLISHLQTMHKMSPGKAQAMAAGKAGK
jgi:hypothetical protein